MSLSTLWYAHERSEVACHTIYSSRHPATVLHTPQRHRFQPLPLERYSFPDLLAERAVGADLDRPRLILVHLFVAKSVKGAQ